MSAPGSLALGDLDAQGAPAPGPAETVEAALAALRAGRNVALVVPEGAASGLVAALRAEGLRLDAAANRLRCRGRSLRLVSVASDPAALRHFNGELILDARLRVREAGAWPALAQKLEARQKIRAAERADRPAPVKQLARLGRD